MLGWSSKKITSESAIDEAEHVPTAVPATRNGANYDPHLLTVLEAQHRAMLRLLDVDPQAARSTDFATLRRQLTLLEHIMSQHLSLENSRLYPYLAHRLRGDPAASDSVALMHLEACCIGSAVSSFVDRYSQPDISERTAAEMLSQAAEILKFLRAHFECEVSEVYALYRSLPRTDPSPPGLA
jgi:hemerythrin-like domain-containing protein